MSSFRRAQNAFLSGGNQIVKNLFLGAESDENKSTSPTRQRSGFSLRRRHAPTQKAPEDGNVPSNSNSQIETSLLVTTSDSVKSPRPVTQADFIDALTAVVTQSGTKSTPEYDDDLWSLSSVSSSNSHVEQGTSLKDENPIPNSGPTLGIGQLFFYLDQNHFPIKDSVSPTLRGDRGISSLTKSPENKETQLSGIPLISSKHELTSQSLQPQQLHNNFIPKTMTNRHKLLKMEKLRDEKDSSNSDSKPEELKQDSNEQIQDNIEFQNNSKLAGSSVSRIRALIEAKTAEADHDGLFQRGCEMFQEGERLLQEGKIHEAREALQRARSFQKRSLQIISRRMANLMHQQGLDHSDRGDTYLAVILLGVAEIMKHRPSASNIHLGAQVHRGYRRICPKERKFRDVRKEIDVALKTIEQEAKPFSRTLQVYSRSLMIDTIPEEIPAT
jgi:hypothetical protein